MHLMIGYHATILSLVAVKFPPKRRTDHVPTKRSTDQLHVWRWYPRSANTLASARLRLAASTVVGVIVIQADHSHHVSDGGVPGIHRSSLQLSLGLVSWNVPEC